MVAPWLFSLAIFLAQGTDLDGAGVDKGDPNAPLLVVEFVDFGCGACALFASGTFPTVDEQLIRTGRIRWKTIPFRLGPFRHSKQATMASLCAAEQNGFWPLHAWLFANRDTWQDPKKPFPVFQAYAGEHGLDTLQFRVCYERDETEDRAKDLRNLARKHGVRATPTFFIGERRVLGAIPAETFVDLVNEALHLFVPRRSTQSDGGGSVLPCADATCPGPPSLRYADGRGTQHGVRDGGALQR